MHLSKRKFGVIYYDCTNFYFKIEQAKDDKQYKLSKGNRPFPIVEMRLFILFSLIPLEEKLLMNFGLSKFVVCTDASLSSTENCRFNNDKDGNLPETARAWKIF